jgi:hypothetical protein
MTKLARFLACVLAVTCTLAVAQKRSTPQRSSPANSGSNCGPVARSQKGTKGSLTPSSKPSTCGTASSLPAQAANLGRVSGQKLAKDATRPGTPDFLPNSTNVSGNQLP